MFGSYEHVGNALHGLFRQFNWHIISLMYHNHGASTGRGNSDCTFSLSAIRRNFENTTSFQDFDEKHTTRDDFRRILYRFKQETRSELNGHWSWHSFVFHFCIILCGTLSLSIQFDSITIHFIYSMIYVVRNSD